MQELEKPPTNLAALRRVLLDADLKKVGGVALCRVTFFAGQKGERISPATAAATGGCPGAIAAALLLGVGSVIPIAP